MTTAGIRHVYGPVPSRRLGRSLGVDLVPFKVCTYDCIYCQLGRTTDKTVERREYVPVGAVLEELKGILAKGIRPDYISLAGSGEPTLNSGIGEIIRGIKSMTDVPVAVLTNGSLLWMPEVQGALMAADLVLPSLVAGDEKLFRHVNRPHGEIAFNRMVEGIAEFTRRFPGEVWLEVFLLDGITAIPAEVEKIAALVRKIAPARTQLNTASRPSAEDFAFPAPRETLERLRHLIPGVVEVIAEGGGDQGSAPVTGKSAEGEMLALLGRRPCTILQIARGFGLNPSEVVKQVENLMKGGALVSERVGAEVFYSRNRGRSGS